MPSLTSSALYARPLIASATRANPFSVFDFD